MTSRGDETLVGRPRARPESRIFPQHSGQIQVEIVGGPMDGAGCRVPKETVIIGRGQDSDLSLFLDPLVSMKHARIVREDRHYWLEDLDSSNGTYLGDEKIRQRTLIGPGTIFVVGETCLEFTPA